MRAFLHRFRRDRRGVTALEFALIAPAMIAFYFGMAEMTQAIMADRRNAHVASAIGDLVAQSSQISTAEVTDIFAIADRIMSPFPSGALKVRVSSITRDSKGVAKIDWCEVNGGMADLNDGTVISDLPANLVGNGESIVMAESSYDYASPVKKYIPGNLTFTEKLYFKPRKSSKVMRTT